MPGGSPPSTPALRRTAPTAGTASRPTRAGASFSLYDARVNPNLALTRLKFMVAATTDPLLDDMDESLRMLLNVARREDEFGRTFNDKGWVPTYHLDWAAAEVWAWKAGAASDRYRIVGDGTDLNRHQVHQHCLKLYELYTKKASNQPHTIRMKGNLLVDRLGAYSAIPWWWSVSA